jgi:peptidoglycan/LPS O-acetylase OafA/YrhL
MRFDPFQRLPHLGYSAALGVAVFPVISGLLVTARYPSCPGISSNHPPSSSRE